jgi:aryl-alcohol dehydrogenase-like predicted oxidoreductase
MVAYNSSDRSHEAVIDQAGMAGIGVVVKKGLGSGHLDPDESIRFVLGNDRVASIVVGSLNLENMRRNIAAATLTSE